MRFLRANKEIFAWEPDEPVGVPRGVIQHHLKVCPNVRPVKQRARWQSTEKQAFIVQETRKLEATGTIWEVRYPEWLANPVVVPKKGGKEWMCIDFTNLNKDCPQDPFPLPRIDQIVHSTAECDLLCFLDAFSGYHQINGGRGCREDGLLDTMWGVLLHLHAFWPSQHGHNLSAANAHRLGAAARQEHRGLR